MKLKPNSKNSKTIQAVYDRFGGTRKSAQVCGYSAELLSNWKRKGRVPLNKVAEISRVLKCWPFDLNQSEVRDLMRAIDEASSRDLLGRTHL